MFERADRIGGLLRYGIPEFKMEKRHIDRRLDQMRAEGTEFRTNANVGVDVPADDLRSGSSTPSSSPAARPRPATCPSPGGSSNGIHQAMEYLPWANRAQEGDMGVDDVPDLGQGQVRS